MSAKDIPTKSVVAVPSGVGSAVGVDREHWYVAIVSHNTEKSVGDKLSKMGVECYVPVQEEHKIWKNGRRAKVDRVVIPSIVFVYCTEHERKEIVNLPFIYRFMTDKARVVNSMGNKPLAIIPDAQINKLRFMVGNSSTPVTFKPIAYKRGDVVRVIRGRLQGLEGEVQMIDDKHSEVTIGLDCLGSASLVIETINVEPVTKKE